MIRLLGRLVWIITALVSINVGAKELYGFDFWGKVPRNMVKILAVIVGIAGIINLVMGLSITFARIMFY